MTTLLRSFLQIDSEALPEESHILRESAMLFLANRPQPVREVGLVSHCRRRAETCFSFLKLALRHLCCKSNIFRRGVEFAEKTLLLCSSNSAAPAGNLLANDLFKHRSRLTILIFDFAEDAWLCRNH